MKMYIAGQWVDKSAKMPVLNPYDSIEIDTVPRGDAGDVDAAISSAVVGADIMARMPSYERYLIIKKAADLIAERSEEHARILSMEEGKTIAEARGEIGRAVQTLTMSAEEGKRIHGETVPLDAAPGTGKAFGFTIRVPCGVVAAICPFNFPLNLVCHKVGPALAAGNAVIIKPASDTPLSALKLTEVLLEAGLPPEAVQCVTGPGGEIGDALSTDRRVRKISFTGSRDVGERICQKAGIKKVTMELGSNSPMIIMPDADLDKVAQATIASGYSNAGQVCISTQRVLVDAKVYGEYLDVLKPQVERMNVGNPQAQGTQMGPMIRESDAIRVGDWIEEAVSSGARVVAGGDREGTLHAPTVVADVTPTMRISYDELFGPAVAVSHFKDIDEAITMANDTIYGLSAGLFTQNLEWAMRFAREVHSGNLMINSSPQFRADLMPYGGLKDSGMGKEGPYYAVQEMTELKMVAFH
ncbi:MAG: aldehyde dehydrogenase family protein [Dehalococcoidia bacterium]|nr:aldehyde dehydrogenase family protein [Dehalococcoidia bacterium]